MKNTYDTFPYKSIRPAQEEAIKFSLDSFASGKRFVIIEAGTGVGKSAIGLTVARELNKLQGGEECELAGGAYFLTTQKILQDQYENDFGKSRGNMKSIKSSSNYTCKFHTKNSCGESLRLLKTTEKGSRFFNTCAFRCVYKQAKKSFLESQASVTNFPYFLAETNYAGHITPRQTLVIDEAHNVETELGKFIEVAISERFAKMIKVNMPEIRTQKQAIDWVTINYLPKLQSYYNHMESMLEKYQDLKSKIKEFVTVAKKYEMLDKHLCKVNRFLKIYDKENWIFNISPAEGKKGRRLEFKPIDVAPYADEMLFAYGDNIVMMSATILNKNAFCETLGIDINDAAFLSIPTPFPAENRPIMQFSIGKMTAAEIDTTLPKLKKAVEAILNEHSDSKGIIHCHTFKIANYLKNNIRNRRLLVHNSENREEVLQKHISSKEPTVLLSPSMTEGVDLHGDRSRFQVICKVPYPYLGDKLVKKRMHKWSWWYSLKTAKTIVQAVGRSVRSKDDTAVTYILDSDFDRFYSRNKSMFPKSFTESLK